MLRTLKKLLRAEQFIHNNLLLRDSFIFPRGTPHSFTSLLLTHHLFFILQDKVSPPLSPYFLLVNLIILQFSFNPHQLTLSWTQPQTSFSF